MAELYHWGIKGMRWGIRRYQNKDGSLTAEGKARLAERGVRTEENLGEKTIPKGTKMYRSTPYQKDPNNGKSIYVTYNDVDRALYRQGYSVKSYVGKKHNDPIYEHEYELKTDLKIPSLKKTREIEQRVIAEAKKHQEVGEAYVKSILIQEHYSPHEISEMSKIAQMISKNGGPSKEMYQKVSKMYNDDWRADDFYNQALQIYKGKEYIDKSDYLSIEQSLGIAVNTKNAIIRELKKEGYNAMYDNAGIGVQSNGRFSKLQEGVEPLIIFDSKSTLNELKTTSVDTAEQQRSGEQYTESINKIRGELRKYRD